MLAEEGFAGHVDAVRAASPRLRQVITIGRPRESLGEQGYEQLLQDNAGALAAAAPVHADTPLWFFYTSGTTGRPKAATLTHGQMAFVVANHLADLIPGTDERDCSIAVAPLSHGAGIHALLNVARGAATVLPSADRLDPAQVWELVQRHRVTNLFAVPTIVKLLVEDPAVDRFDHGSLRYVVYAGAPMYHADQQRALRKLGPVLVQYFGLGEVTGCITVLPPSMHSLDDGGGAPADTLIGTCGRPRTGMEVAILDHQLQPVPTGAIGEICCRGPAVFPGYHDNPEATAQAFRGGWFHTGDLGRLDARGLLYITGRESDMYISGGSNVYPREVEEALLTHPAVAEVAVLGMPDATWGEIGVAVVVARGNADATAAEGLTAEALLAHLEGRCARYRWPRQFHFWDALPRSGYGKVAKKDIRERLLQDTAQGKEQAAPIP
jgi:acyl-CoA synthetase (AMP-forming)/AMP-acid ligase II